MAVGVAMGAAFAASEPVTDLHGERWVALATIRVDGRPIVKKNSRTIGTSGARPISLPSAAYRNWAKTAVYVVMAQWRALGRFTPVGGAQQPVWLRCRFALPKGGFADLSNLYEGIQDVLQDAGVLHNDRWIAHHDGSRIVAADTPHVEVTVHVPVSVVPVRGAVA